MKTLLPYLLQVILISGLLYTYYHLALRNKPLHRFNRFYLIGATVVSLLLPLLQIDLYLKPARTESVLFSEPIITYDAITTTRVHTEASTAFNWQQLTWLIYLLITAVFLCRLLVTLVRLFLMRYRNPVQPVENFLVIQTDAPGTPYSFFRWLFWNRSLPLNSVNGRQIFHHERYHIQQHHSADLFYLELLTVTCWFNPFFHLIKKETKAIHEFLADQHVASGSDSWQYAELLLMRVLDTHQPLVHPFFYSQIKRRIAMLTNSHQTRHPLLRKWMVLPFALAVTGLFSFTIREKPSREMKIPLSRSAGNDTTPLRIVIRQTGTNGTTLPAPKTPTTTQLNDWRTNTRYSILIDEVPVANEKLSNYQPGDFSAYTIAAVVKNDRNAPAHDFRIYLMTTSFYKQRVRASTTGQLDPIGVEVKGDLQPVTREDGITGRTSSLQDVLIVIDGIKQPLNASTSTLNNLLPPDEIYSVTILKDEKAIQKYGPEAAHGVIEIITKTKAGKGAAEKTVTQLEQRAHFPGGDTSWRQFLIRNINASVPVDNGAPEGQYKVTLRFIVRPNGQLDDIQALTNHGYGMEAETIRLLRAGPNWTPAMQDGKAVSAYVQQSVSFVVEEEKETKRNGQ